MKVYVIAGIAILAFVFGVIYVFAPGTRFGGEGFTGNLDTYSAGFTVATSTVNTTSTQVVASTNILTTLINRSASNFTCKPDDRGTAAASSSVVADFGYVLPATSTSNPVSYLSFGECQPGMSNCFPFKGTLNCVGDTAGTIIKISH